MTPEEIMVEPTEIELSDMMLEAIRIDHQLSKKGVSTLRRLVFSWSELKGEVKQLKYRLNHQTEDDIENCKRGHHGKDCGV